VELISSNQLRVSCLECIQIFVGGINLKMNQRREEIPRNDMGQGFGVLLLFKNNLAIERPFYLRGAAGAKSQIWNQNRRKTSDSSSRLESDECTAIRCMIVGARKAGAKRMI
jgi:hypothetical protein